MKESNDVLKLVDSNGELVGKINSKTQYIGSRKQAEGIKWKGEMEAFRKLQLENDGNFIWTYPAKIQELIQSPEFSKADISMLVYLATYVNGSGYLAKDNKSTRMDKADIKEILEASRNLFDRFFNKLIHHDILEVDGKTYKWNQSYNFYGSTKGITNPNKLVRSYVNQIRSLYLKKKENGKRMYTPTKLYPIFAVVPYLHHSSNIVCKNPDVKDVEDIIYFSLSEIADILALNDSKKMSASLSSLLLDGQTSFVKVESKNEKYLKLNPRIFWAGKYPATRELQSEFDMIDNNRNKRKKK